MYSDIQSFLDELKYHIGLGGPSSNVQDLAKEICALHPTEQQRVMTLFLECIAIWGKRDESKQFVDDRNAATCKASAVILKTLEFDYDDKHRPFAYINGRPALPHI